MQPQNSEWTVEFQVISGIFWWHLMACAQIFGIWRISSLFSNEAQISRQQSTQYSFLVAGWDSVSLGFLEVRGSFLRGICTYDDFWMNFRHYQYFRYMGVSKNNGTPKSSILIGFSIINHPFWGTTIFGNTHMIYEYITIATYFPWIFYWIKKSPCWRQAFLQTSRVKKPWQVWTSWALGLWVKRASRWGNCWLVVGPWKPPTSPKDGRLPSNQRTNQPTNKNTHLNAKTRQKKNGAKKRANKTVLRKKLQGFHLASIAIEHCGGELVLGFGITVTTSL